MRIRAIYNVFHSPNASLSLYALYLSGYKLSLNLVSLVWLGPLFITLQGTAQHPQRHLGPVQSGASCLCHPLFCSKDSVCNILAIPHSLPICLCAYGLAHLLSADRRPVSDVPPGVESSIPLGGRAAHRT